MPATHLTTPQRIGIGTSGGVCLVLLKLIESRFYLQAPTSLDALAAYLTYAGYLVMGAMAALYLGDGDLPIEKARRSTFTTGLLAPSILLALVASPVASKEPAPESPQPVTKISSLFFSQAYAAPVEEKPALPEPRTEKNSVVKLTRESVSPSFTHSLWRALGRPVATEDSLVILGVADTEDKAFAAAARVDALLSRSDPSLPKSTVLQPEGSREFFVSLGGLQTRSDASKLLAASGHVALNILSSNTKPDDHDTPALLLKGQVMTGQQVIDSHP